MSALQTPPICDELLRWAHGSLVCGAPFSRHHLDPASPMRLLSATIFLTLFAVTFSAGAASVSAASLPAAHQVDIPLGNGVLHAQLYKPDGDGPFPTVIALHGCGGLGGRSAPGQPPYRGWAGVFFEGGGAGLPQG